MFCLSKLIVYLKQASKICQSRKYNMLFSTVVLCHRLKDETSLILKQKELIQPVMTAKYRYIRGVDSTPKIYSVTVSRFYI